MNTINAVLLLVLCLAASAAAEDFTSDSPSPLGPTRHVRPEASVVHFAGTISIALLGAESAARLRAKTLLSAEGDATVTIGEYQTVVECDHRWCQARLVAVAASRDIAVATGESQHSAC